jgi:hypothetical protein
MVMHGQVCQKGSYLLRSHVFGVALWGGACDETR